MNKVRIIGLVLLVASISLRLIIENEDSHFVFGVMMGLGVGFLITGKLKKREVG